MSPGQLWRALILSLLFLTRIPVPVRFEPSALDWGRSAALFPGAGLVIGLILVLVHLLVPEGRPGVEAALVLTVWVLITGGLHLDGLADSFDAWIGGYGNRARTLEIMKDPRAGPMAVMGVGLVLILKFAALQALLEGNHWPALLLVPVLGRGAILTLLLTTPYVRPEGIGVAHAGQLPRIFAIGLVMVIGLLTGLVWSGAGLILLVLLGLGGWGLRRILIDRLGGATGDTLGAGCELTEAGALTVLALVLPL